MFEFEENSKKELTKVWVEKYRPKTVKECILPPRLQQQFNDMVKAGDITNLHLTGSPGTGKTTIARALCHDLGVDYIIINMSNDSGIETVRTTIVDYISKASISKISKKFKVVILDECLEENETVRVGTLDNWKAVKLNQLEKNIDYPIVSFNMDTREFENDIGSIISDKEDEIYELELEDGSTIKVTGNHPFIVCDINNNIVERTINEGFEEGDKIVKYE